MRTLMLIGLFVVMTYATMAQSKNRGGSAKENNNIHKVENQRSSKSNSSTSKSNKEVPNKAQKHFGSNYGKNAGETWGKESDGGYRSEFKQDGKEYTVRYSEKGNWTSTERHMTDKSMPSAVLNSYKRSKYSNGNVSSYSFVKNSLYTSGVYLLTILLGGQQKCLYYNSAGKLLKVN